jgi:RNA polymerase sigma-70 factor (ECF subfamily)
VHLEPLETLLPSPSDPILTIPAPGAGPLDEHLRREAERAVGEALARLPEHFRLPLVLADIAELSTAEIAKILGLKEATVKTRIHRARLAVRRALIERLPAQPAPDVAHDRQVCLDLLRAKQEALDRRASFPFSSEELCARCQSVFAALELGRDVCGLLGTGELPASIRELIRHHGEPLKPRSGRRASHR